MILERGLSVIIGYLELDIPQGDYLLRTGVRDWILFRGQAMVTLLFFVIMVITITAGAVIVLFSNSLSGTRFQQSSVAYQVAQSGAENAILRLLRDSTYRSETLVIGTGTASIVVTDNGGGSYTILSKGTSNNLTRQIQMNITTVNNVSTVTSQKEVF